ncbi:uncharacterized protein MELLADRAFT_61917 [Melampsora larici-populina 98AG31]|uniref:SigF-like NTF2-like domain-containing protein n=1 Tax=Melampsora larici-populina (strain 98AG31 / pathotype 3-4-7) TaxID=747676 RepID=F4RGY4_MELLP|nr:uncharacterized protein MELLADRAFT_61917 [Melampsora larici-populina 98AG31]EGG08404.1 hypothetical protein MELLADRAFT_61917 [Melampsora larici-populina 98AG31]
MNDPVKELPDVVRACAETYEATKIANYLDTYFTENAFILHPLINQPARVHGKEYLKGIYKVYRIFLINNQVRFHAVTFNENKTQAALEFTERLEPRFLPAGLFVFHIKCLSRLDLEKSSDGKYRITRQDDQFVSDLNVLGILPFNQILVSMITFMKSFAGFWVAIIGKYLLEKEFFGA